MDALQAELQSLRKGKVSLAEALHQLDLVSSSLTRIQDLERTVAAQEHTIEDLRSLMKYFVSTTGLRAALEQFTQDVHSALDSKLTTFRESVDRQLDLRPEQMTVDAALNTKASAATVSALQDQVRSLRGQFETLSSSVFESFKVEVKRSLASKLDAGMLRDTVKDVVDSQPWKSLVTRISLVEQAMLDLTSSPEPVLDAAQMFPDPSSPLIRLIDTGTGSAGVESPVPSPRHHSSSLINLQVAELERSVTAIQQVVTDMQQDRDIARMKSDDRLEELERTQTRLMHAVRELEALRNKVGVGEGRKSPERSPRRSVERAPSPNLDRYIREQELASKRFVQLETDVNSLLITTKFLKSREKEKFTEIIKSLKCLNESRETLTRELAVLKTQTEEMAQSHSQAVSNLTEELLTLRGPMIDMISTQAKESGALNMEIRRHQETLRSIVKGESGLTLESRLMTPAHPGLKYSHQSHGSRIEFQQRVQSASPSVRLRKRLNPAKKTEEVDAKPQVKESKYLSQRSTPRGILDVEKSLSRMGNTEH